MNWAAESPSDWVWDQSLEDGDCIRTATPKATPRRARHVTIKNIRTELEYGV